MTNEQSKAQKALLVAHKALLAKVQDLQTQFWDALKELETATGLEIDGTQDLSNYTLQQLYSFADGDGGRTRIGNTPTCEDCGNPQDDCDCDEHCDECMTYPCSCDTEEEAN